MAETYYNEETDDYEKELQQLSDDKTGAEDNVSPPPTLDESMSDHESSPVPIGPMAATVTLKTLESPRSVIFTSPSRPTSGITTQMQENSSDGINTVPNMVDVSIIKIDIAITMLWHVLYTQHCACRVLG